MPDELPEVSNVPEESEFEAAFAEFAADPSSDSAGEDDPTISDEAKKEEVPDKQVDKQDKPASDGDQAAKDGGDVAAGAADPEDKTPDRYAGLNEEDREYFKTLEERAAKADELQHRIDSDAGRVSAFQRKINGLQSEIQSIRKGGTTGQPTEDEIADAMKGSDEGWKQFSEDYPQIAGAIDSRFERSVKVTKKIIDDSLAPVKDSQERIITNEATTAAEQRIAAVAEHYPTWTEEVQKTEFKLWLDDQPPGVNALAESEDIQDAVALFDRYDQHLVANGKTSLKPDPGPGVDKKAEEKPAGAEQSELDKRRAQQLQDGVSAASRSAGVNADAPATDKFEAAFNAYAKLKEQRRA